MCLERGTGRVEPELTSRGLDLCTHLPQMSIDHQERLDSVCKVPNQAGKVAWLAGTRVREGGLE